LCCHPCVEAGVSQTCVRIFSRPQWPSSCISTPSRLTSGSATACMDTHGTRIVWRLPVGFPRPSRPSSLVRHRDFRAPSPHPLSYLVVCHGAYKPLPFVKMSRTAKLPVRPDCSASLTSRSGNCEIRVQSSTRIRTKWLVIQNMAAVVVTGIPSVASIQLGCVKGLGIGGVTTARESSRLVLSSGWIYPPTYDACLTESLS